MIIDFSINGTEKFRGLITTVITFFIIGKHALFPRWQNWPNTRFSKMNRREHEVFCAEFSFEFLDGLVENSDS